MIIEMLRWWYGAGWMHAMHRMSLWPSGVSHAFSVTILARTLFAPWRRITSNAGHSIDAKMHAAMDNFVSRCVGFVVRSIVLLTAGCAAFGAFIGGIIMVIVWPLLPIASIGFLVWGIIG